MDYDGVLHPEPVHWHPRRGAFLREELAVPGQVGFSMDHRDMDHVPAWESHFAWDPETRQVVRRNWSPQ